MRTTSRGGPWTDQHRADAVNVAFVAGLFAGAIVLPADAHSSGVILGVALGYAMLAAWYAAVNLRRPPAMANSTGHAA